MINVLLQWPITNWFVSQDRLYPRFYYVLASGQYKWVRCPQESDNLAAERVVRGLWPVCQPPMYLRGSFGYAMSICLTPQWINSLRFINGRFSHWKSIDREHVSSIMNICWFYKDQYLNNLRMYTNIIFN